MSSRNVANEVEDDVVKALADTVTEAFPRISHRYYAMKAKWMGLEKLEPYDRNAPLPEADDAKIPWTDAQRPRLGRLRRLRAVDGSDRRRLF